jgi:hypothetical protein
MTLQEIDSKAFRETFAHRVFGSHGNRLHYVIGGSGDPVLLVPGWPQSSYAFRRVMPLLAERFTVDRRRDRHRHERTPRLARPIPQRQQSTT